MSRKVTIVNNETQSQKTFMSNATTLGELKNEAVNAGIVVTDKSWYEGHLRAEIIDDNAVLPTSVMYKGLETTDLTFLLTTTAKKIKSGGRYDVYKQIVDMNLQETCKSVYGKNYTQVSTANLEKLIAENSPEEVPCEGCVSKGLAILVQELFDEGIISYNTYKQVMGIKEEETLSEKEINEMFDFVK